MAKLSGRSCRIRDDVRDSKILWDVLSKIDQNIDSFDLEKTKQLVLGAERDFTRKSTDEQQCWRYVGSSPGFEDRECWFRNYKEEEDPFHGFYHRYGGSDSLIVSFKRNLPAFDGFWHIEDLMSWIEAIDDFFEEISPPEHLKCKIVWYKMKGAAYYWWKQLQRERIICGKEEITSWPRMKKLLFNRFLPTKCSTEFLNQLNKKEKGEDVKHLMAGDFTHNKCLIKAPSESNMYKHNEKPSFEETVGCMLSDYGSQLMGFVEGHVDEVIEGNISDQLLLTAGQIEQVVLDENGDSYVIGGTKEEVINDQLPWITVNQLNKVLEAKMNTFYGPEGDKKEMSQSPIGDHMSPSLFQSLKLLYEEGNNIGLSILSHCSGNVLHEFRGAITMTFDPGGNDSINKRRHYKDFDSEDDEHDIEVDNAAHAPIKCVRVMPQLEIFCYLLVLVFFINLKRYNEAKTCSLTGFAFNRRTLEVLASRLHFYYSLCYEIVRVLVEIRGNFLGLHQIATLRHVEMGQKTLFNVLLQNYLFPSCGIFLQNEAANDRMLSNPFHVVGSDDWKAYDYSFTSRHFNINLLEIVWEVRDLGPQAFETSQDLKGYDIKMLCKIVYMNFDPGGVRKNKLTMEGGQGRGIVQICINLYLGDVGINKGRRYEFSLKRAFCGIMLHNALLDMYVKYKYLKYSVEVFCCMKRNNLVTWKSIMCGCLSDEFSLEENKTGLGVHGAILKIRDLVAGSAMISTNSQTGQPFNAFNLYRSIQLIGGKSNDLTFVCLLLHYCDAAASSDQAFAMGKFTEDQSLVYDVVLHIHNAIMSTMKPRGWGFAMNILGAILILEYLRKWGLVIGVVDDILIKRFIKLKLLRQQKGVQLPHTPVQGKTSRTASRIVELACIVALSISVMLMNMKWDKQICGYSTTLQQHGLDINYLFMLEKIVMTPTGDISTFLFSTNKIYITRGRVISWEGWNNVDNTNTEGGFLMAKLSVGTFTSCLSTLCDNGHFKMTLRLFFKLVNGLDPPNAVMMSLRSLNVESYGFARGRASCVGGWTDVGTSKLYLSFYYRLNY